MQQHFCRPGGLHSQHGQPAGSLGGLAGATRRCLRYPRRFPARDFVLIETVGVGQDEVDVVRLADITVGDSWCPNGRRCAKASMAGIMEIADIFVITRADHPGAERVEREIRALQSLVVRTDRWTPPS